MYTWNEDKTAITKEGQFIPITHRFYREIIEKIEKGEIAPIGEYNETLKTQKTEQAQKEKEESQKKVIPTDADLAIEMAKTLMAEGITAQNIIDAVRKT